ncbi:hypothetical protein ACFSW8_08545 [Rubritalea tangerina]|uniref:Tetratricopeptide repeat protein n=2 Tax=Rubritalea tangerina TaxID=430798 RepID=A0ABW4ZAG5_9BACT
MSKLLRKCKKWLSFHGRTVGITVVVMGALGAGVYYAITTDKAPEQIDFGDASISDWAQEVSDLSFEDGLRLIAEGEEAKARAVMNRLAPLPQASTEAIGNPKAHLWRAQELLSGKESGSILRFPLSLIDGEKLSLSYTVGVTEVTDRCARHLKAAIELDPSLDEAILILVDLRLAQGKRNLAIESLFEIVEASERPEIGVLIAHCGGYDGDDLKLEEEQWQILTVGGRAIQQSKRGNLGFRVAHVLRALVLGQEELANSGIATIERDFPGKEIGKKLQAQVAYFRAVRSLNERPYQVESTIDNLVLALRSDPSLNIVVEALEATTQRYPEQKERVRKEIQTQVKEGDDSNGVLLVYLSDLYSDQPGEAYRLAKQAWEKGPEEVAFLVNWGQCGLRVGQYEEALEEVSERLGTAIERGERFELLVLQGEIFLKQEEWEMAVESLEQALALGEGRYPELHQKLAQAYEKMGKVIIAEEHRVLAGK